MAIPKLTPLPPAPSRSDAPTDFTSKADAFVAAQGTMVTEANASIDGINAITDTINQQAETAATAATNAATSEANAKTYQDSAQTAAAAAQASAGLPSLAGNALKVLQVNSAANGVQWGAISQAISRYFESAQQTITASGTLTLAHGLGAVPKIIQAHLVCLTADVGYAVGDRVEVATSIGAYYSSTDGNYAANMTVIPDATNLTVLMSTGTFYLHNKSSLSTRGPSKITAASWKLVLRAAA